MGTISSLSDSGTLTIGNSGPGILNTGALTLASGGILNVDLDGSTAGSGYAQIDASGAVSLNGETLDLNTGSYLAPANAQFTIIKGNSPINGTFRSSTGANLTEGSTFTVNGQIFKISYLNDSVVLTAEVPSYYVNPAWSTYSYGQFILDADPVTPGNQNAYYGETAFSTIDAAIAAAPSLSNVVVNQGTYSEDVLLNKQLTLTFQQGPIGVGALADTVSNAVISINGITLTIGTDDTDTNFSLASQVTGTGGIDKSGTGTFTLENVSNNYTGNTEISSGVLVLGSATALGSSADVIVDSSGTLVLSGYAVTLPNLTGTGVVENNGQAVALTFNQTGTDNFAGSLEDGTGSSLSVIQAGTGTLILSGSNTYTGATSVNTGKLNVDGTLSVSSTVTVAPGATLGGDGNIPGSVNVTGGILAPTLGGASGLTISDGLTLARNPLNVANPGTFDAVINGPTPGTQVTQVLLSGGLTIGASNLVLSIGNGYSPSPGTQFDLIENQDFSPESGTFKGLSEGSLIIANGEVFEITYAGGSNGNDVVLTAKATTTTTITGTENTIPLNSDGTYSATVTSEAGSGLGTPTGTVTFDDNTLFLGTAPLNSNGVATFTANFTVGGEHSITATYNADGQANLLPSTSAQAFNQEVTPLRFIPGDVLIEQVGDGVNALSNTAGNAIYLDEYNPQSGVEVQSIALPTAGSGAQAAIIAEGNDTTQGFISLSGDGRYVTVTGYGVSPGTNSTGGTLASTNANQYNRVVGRVDDAGDIDTSTSLSNFAINGAPNSVYTTDGTNIYVAGGTGGVGYTTLGAASMTTLSSAPANTGVIEGFGGQLYYSSSKSGMISLGTTATCTGGISSSATTAYQLSNLGITFNATTDPNGFFFATLNPGSTAYDTLYIADSSQGLLKYSLVGGTWQLNGAIGTVQDAYQSLTGVVSDGIVTLYATKGDGANGVGGGELAIITDNTGYDDVNGSFSSLTPQILLQLDPGSNEGLRSIALVPQLTTVYVQSSWSTLTQGEAVTDADPACARKPVGRLRRGCLQLHQRRHRGAAREPRQCDRQRRDLSGIGLDRYADIAGISGWTGERQFDFGHHSRGRRSPGR